MGATVAAPAPALAVLSVALGGAVGAALRYLIVTLSASWWPAFPLGTLLVNALGCFLAGLVLPWAGAASAAYALLVVGFCGGFTTMSAFGLDVWWLLEAGHYRRAALYFALTMLLGLAGVLAGLELSRLMIRP